MQPLGCSTVHAPVVDGTGRRLVSAGDAPIHKHDMSVTYDGPSWVSVLDQNSTRHARPCWGSPRLLRSSLSSCRPCRNCKCFCPSSPHLLKRRPHVLHFNSRPADFGGFKRGRPSSSSRSTASWATTHSWDGGPGHWGYESRCHGRLVYELVATGRHLSLVRLGIMAIWAWWDWRISELRSGVRSSSSLGAAESS